MRQFPDTPSALAFFLILTGAANLDSVAAEQAETQEQSVKVYRDWALGNEGDVARGRMLFSDPRTACAQCHTTDGTSRGAGPDLYAAGDKFPRAELIRSVLEPSATIMIGYATTIVKTKEGNRFAGIVKSISDTEIILAVAGDIRQRVARDAIEDQHQRDYLQLHVRVSRKYVSTLISVLNIVFARYLCMHSILAS